MPAPKTPSFIAELKSFAANLKDVPYDKLLPSAAEAGWDYLLNETSAIGQPDGTVLVTFSVSVGREGKYEVLDNLSVKTGTGPGPVSLAARVIAQQALIYLFFGRLPAPAAPAPQQTVDVTQQPAGDIKLPGEDPLPPEDVGNDRDIDDQEYVPDTAALSRRDKVLPDLVDHVEPDGVPVFRDLDELPEHFTDAQIITRLLEDIDKAAVRFSSREQLVAMFDKNSTAIGVKDSFLADLGTAADRTRLKDILDRHADRIEAAAKPPREVRIPGGKGSASETAPRRRRAA